MKSDSKNSKLTGVVLAGGKSSRLGQDKALLRLDNETLLARTIRLLSAVTGQVLVVGRSAPADEAHVSRVNEPANHQIKYIEDERPGCGPAGGIATALKFTSGDCLVLSCDLPFMNEELLLRLSEAWERRERGILSVAYRSALSGKRESLVAIYGYDCLPFLNERIEQGLFKMSLMLPKDSLAELEYSSQQEKVFFNLNTPEDLDNAKKFF